VNFSWFIRLLTEIDLDIQAGLTRKIHKNKKEQLHRRQRSIPRNLNFGAASGEEFDPSRQRRDAFRLVQKYTFCHPHESHFFRSMPMDGDPFLPIFYRFIHSQKRKIIKNFYFWDDPKRRFRPVGTDQFPISKILYVRPGRIFEINQWAILQEKNTAKGD
jgi:hypothetical protein